MKFSAVLTAAMASLAVADDPLCDKYTKALLKDNTAANQKTLLTLLVNTVVIGNYTMPNVGVSVPGILAPGEVNGKKVNLLPYFDGTLASTNRGDKAVCKNFLDDGGAEPLKKNMPAAGTSSNQYFLLTHLYEFFGTLLGCSQQGMAGFDKYDGQASMYKVHKFMNLGEAELTYFISQVGAAAASFGVAKDDITAVANALSSTFGMKCSAPAEVGKGSGAQPQAICIADGCPEAKDPQCSAYAAAVAPAKCSASSMSMSGSMMPSGTSMPSGSGSMSGSAPASMTGTMTKPATTNPTGAAGVNGVNIAAAAAAIAALAL